MEDHLLEIFGGHDTRFSSDDHSNVQTLSRWSNEALQELSKIPGFVRGRVRKNTEKFADANDIREISLSVMYKAKEANKA
jgi:light-independent protochlorophyllide reductase subunit B